MMPGWLRRYATYFFIFALVIYAEHQILLYHEGKQILDRMIAERDNNETRVYLLLIDAADPQIINYLIDKGQLPNFKRLKEEGAYGELQSFAVPVPYGREILSPPVIATILTGRIPEEHGMVSHIFTRGGPDYYYPFKDMPVPSLWNIANYYNKTVGIVGLHGAFPVEHVNGFVVSGEYMMKHIGEDSVGLLDRIRLDYAFPDKELLFPKNLESEIAHNLPPIRKTKEEFDKYGFNYDFPRDTEDWYIRVYNNTLRDEPERIELQIAYEVAQSNRTAFFAFADDFNRMTISNCLYRMYNPDLFIEYLPSLDYFSNLYHTYEYTNYSNLSSLMFQYYKFYDEHIGRIMDEISNMSVFIVISDHGALNLQHASEYSFTGMRRDKGILFIFGNKTHNKKIITNVSVYIIAPTVLHTLGLPVPHKMHGATFTEAMNER
ncbi:MAG: alkaline phosphatase family protein [Candidatus Woesearchaeota archaeon]